MIKGSVFNGKNDMKIKTKRQVIVKPARTLVVPDGKYCNSGPVYTKKRCKHLNKDIENSWLDHCYYCVVFDGIELEVVEDEKVKKCQQCIDSEIK